MIPSDSRGARNRVIPDSLPYGGESPFQAVGSGEVIPGIGNRWKGRGVRKCKDCGPGSKRPAVYPGPRCATHHRAKVKADRARSAAQRVQKTYTLSERAYKAILEAQGGGCGWCGRKPRKGGRRLAVDHDHACCPGPTSCGNCVRGLLCWTCNKMLQHLGDSPLAVQAGAAYLMNPPAVAVLHGVP